MRVVYDGESRHLDDDDYGATYEYIEVDGDLSDKDAIAELDAIRPRMMGDNCHIEADAVLLSLVSDEVRAAYWAVNAREQFHYS